MYPQQYLLPTNSDLLNYLSMQGLLACSNLLSTTNMVNVPQCYPPRVNLDPNYLLRMCSTPQSYYPHQVNNPQLGMLLNSPQNTTQYVTNLPIKNNMMNSQVSEVKKFTQKEDNNKSLFEHLNSKAEYCLFPGFNFSNQKIQEISHVAEVNIIDRSDINKIREDFKLNGTNDVEWNPIDSKQNDYEKFYKPNLSQSDYFVEYRNIFDPSDVNKSLKEHCYSNSSSSTSSTPKKGRIMQMKMQSRNGFDVRDKHNIKKEVDVYNKY
jgi:hypothetical protein